MSDTNQENKVWTRYFQLDESEMEFIKKGIGVREHPFNTIMSPQTERDKQVSANTERAVKQIFRYQEEKRQNLPHTDWLKKIKKNRFLTEDYSTSSGALGEIRAYGYLIEAGLLPIPNRNGGADFSIQGDDGEVEVHSKNLNDDELEKLKKFYKNTEEKANNNPGSWTISLHITTPFATPKTCKKSVTENVISKLCKIKIEEHQLRKDRTSILWLDFQDTTWSGFSVNRIFPLFTHNGNFHSGEFWYAFYGWEGAPIFEGFSWDLPLNDPVKMQHDGRFRLSKKLDAVIISFPRNTVILENPYSTKPIQPSLWKQLVFLPWFNWEYSYLNWPHSDLEQRIQSERERIICLFNTLDGFSD